MSTTQTTVITAFDTKHFGYFAISEIVQIPGGTRRFAFKWRSVCLSPVTKEGDLQTWFQLWDLASPIEAERGAAAHSHSSVDASKPASQAHVGSTRALVDYIIRIRENLTPGEAAIITALLAELRERYRELGQAALGQAVPKRPPIPTSRH